MIDALLEVVNKLRIDHTLQQRFAQRFAFLKPNHRIVLVTGHRRESFGDGSERICEALIATAKIFSDVDIVYPAHLNPNVREPVNRLLAGIANIYPIDPLDYLPFVCLMNRANIILTDSGGIQEEASALGKPVLLMRDTTERPEAVQAGTVKLIGTEVAATTQHLLIPLTDKTTYNSMARAHYPYSDGKARQGILDALASGLLKSPYLTPPGQIRQIRMQNKTTASTGLPTAAAFASRKVKVIGVDVDVDVDRHAVDSFNRGQIHIVEPDLDMMVQAAVSQGYSRATTKPEPAGALLIAVPTPFKGDHNGDHEPDKRYIEAASKSIAPVLKNGDLVILESTSPVGATEQMASLAGHRSARFEVSSNAWGIFRHPRGILLRARSARPGAARASASRPRHRRHDPKVLRSGCQPVQNVCSRRMRHHQCPHRRNVPTDRKQLQGREHCLCQRAVHHLRQARH